ITRDALLAITDGQRRLMTVAEQPALAAVGDVFFPVLSGDLAALQHAFTLSAHGDGSAWTLELTPLDEPLNRFIASIHLQGSADLERLQLRDLKGDTTTMQFSNVQRTPASLSDTEQAHFDF
ncbi:MAG TPA: LolA-related protein, partial [Pseudomonadales bacterium]